MASDGVLERTRQADLQPLVVNGVPVFRMYGQIRVELLRSLSQDHLGLFADPNPDPVTGDIQWFSPMPGETVRLADCSEDDRAGLEFHLARLVDEIIQLIDKLNASGAENSLSMANVLTMALEIPDKSHIFVVGGRPVIAGWGHVPRGPAVQQEILRVWSKVLLTIEQPPEIAPAPPTPPEPQQGAAPPPATPPADQPAQPIEPPVATDGSRVHALIPIVNEVAGPARLALLNRWLWPLLAVLLVAIGYLLLRYCGLGWPLSLVANNNSIVNYCIASSEPLRSNDLSAHLADLQAALAEKQRRLCAAPRPTPTPTPMPTPAPTPTPSPTPDGRERVERELGAIGAVNVILTWNTTDDLDLHVTCPSGEKIYYNEKNKCGGVLDVDKNSNSGNKTTTPVENVTWPLGAARAGTYKVEVNPYRREGSAPIDFKVQLLIQGVVKETHNRRVETLGTMRIFEFTMPYVERPQ